MRIQCKRKPSRSFAQFKMEQRLLITSQGLSKVVITRVDCDGSEVASPTPDGSKWSQLWMAKMSFNVKEHWSKQV
uniref:Uncharacterized protein n=1 Tax=Panagrellus redivivus TaxID=6233 RepID=A0A7E4VAN0_PANRE